jgi:flagellar motor switch protein FliN/FliY
MLEQAIQAFLDSAAVSVESLSGATCEVLSRPAPVAIADITDADREVAWIANIGPNSALKTSILASTSQAEEVGRFILEAAGLDSFDAASLKSTYFEMLAQAASSWTQKLTVLLDQKVEINESGESASFYPSLTYFPVTLRFGEKTFRGFLGVAEAFFQKAQPAMDLPAAPPLTGGSPPNQYELLLDVELPVSISFGRALVPLKEILKLNSGSIVELDRAVTEPVEVIVNNCVIARGEVVVVEGNYGVRIQRIISRHDRLSTMK